MNNYSIYWSETSHLWFVEDKKNDCNVGRFKHEMDARKEAERLNAKAQVCEKCEGKGVYPAASGPDDFTMEVCDCEAGKKKEMLEEVLSDDEFGGTTVGDVLNMVAHND